MPPPRASSADFTLPVPAARGYPSSEDPASEEEPHPAPEDPSPEQTASLIRAFVHTNPAASLMEDGQILFDLASAQHTLSTKHGRCTLHVWSAERNLVRTVASVEERKGALRLNTQRFGVKQTKMLHLVTAAQRSTPRAKEPARKGYLRQLERALARTFPDWKTEGFRAAMDLERSFGPAYVRGTLVRGKEAWAVIGVGAAEAQAVIDGILTLGILWLHHCRERGDGRRIYKGLRVVVPRGAAMLTLARLQWINTAAAQWELFELDDATEELIERDPADQGNLRTRLLHLPDEGAARDRFAEVIAHVMALVPPGQEHRVEQRLRSGAELGFLLHGFEFARARLSPTPGGFGHAMEVTAGHGAAQTPLTPETRRPIAENIAELFRRRDPQATPNPRTLRPGAPSRSIGRFTGRAAHARVPARAAAIRTDTPGPLFGAAPGRSDDREPLPRAHRDPLFRALPERWLESVLRENLAPLTRSLARTPQAVPDPIPAPGFADVGRFANEEDPDTRGNRLEPPQSAPHGQSPASGRDPRRNGCIPRFDPRFVYTQVPAIAGASDRGMLDLLGMTADGRLAVIELKAADDLQLALQGLDYWIRVRQHHTGTSDGPARRSDLQRHGYFRDVELSPLPPRLYLVAPALHIHPATETILRYLSPQVEWTLLALDERWRQGVHVVWRKSSVDAR